MVLTLWAAWSWTGVAQAQTAATSNPAPAAPAPAASVPPATTPVTTAPATKASPSQEKPQPASSDTANLDTVVVTESDLTTTDVAAHDLSQVSGGTNLILSSDYLKGRSANIGDVLRYQPGVLAQSNNGGDQTRYSIRGSGISRTASSVPQGIQFLISGQSLKSSSGYPLTLVLEPLAINYVEVFRGQAAFADYGPLAIGGAINFVTKTGYDASPFQVRTEVGSDSYFNEQASSGLVEGKFDYYASVTHYDYNGFRDDDRGSGTRVIANVGEQVTPDFSTRFNVEYATQAQQNPGSLTLANVEHAPQQSQYQTPTTDYVSKRNDPMGLQASSDSTLRIDDDSSLSFGGLFEESLTQNVGSPTSNTEFTQYATNASAHYKRQDTLFGDEDRTKVTLISNNIPDGNELLLAPSPGGYTTTGKAQFQGNDEVIVLSNDLEVLPNFWINPGIAGMYQHRGVEADNITGANRSKIDKDYEDFVPDIGLRYEFTPESQVYFNAGRTVEAPYGVSYLQTNAAGNAAQNLLNLKKQISDTVEVGTRGSEGLFQWDLALYNSWIQNELLQSYIPATSTTIASNAGKTTHQGIEVGLNTILWHEEDPNKPSDNSLWAAEPKQPPHRLVFQQTYTLSHFTFDNDSNFGYNQIPGVPVELYQAELRYEHPSGFHIGPTVESSLTHYFADYANTISAPAYVIWGAKVGYAPAGKHWDVFFEGDNLSDTHYVSIVSPVVNAKGLDTAAYTPGDVRSVTGGFSYAF